MHRKRKICAEINLFRNFKQVIREYLIVFSKLYEFVWFRHFYATSQWEVLIENNLYKMDSVTPRPNR